MKPLRICYLGWAGHVHVERWAGHFAGQGHEVSVIGVGDRGRYPAGVRQHTLMRGRGARWTRAELRWRLWRLRPQLVHVHWAHFATLVAPVWRGPLVVTAWGSDIYRRDRFSDAEWAALGAAMRRADLVTCDSHDLAQTIRREFSLAVERVRVIQWGVDTASFTTQGPDMRAELGLAGREVVLSARNFTPLYNQHTVVAAFARLAQARPAAFLLMKNYGGDARVLQAVREDIASRGLQDRVRILDTVPYEQMPALYRTADVTVSIPSSDAAPMSVLEAMACGSAVVACDLPSLREWVQPGQTGCLVDAHDDSAVAAAMQSLLDDPAWAGSLRTRAREAIVARASQDVHMRAAARCCEALVAGQPPAALDAALAPLDPVRGG